MRLQACPPLLKSDFNRHGRKNRTVPIVALLVGLLLGAQAAEGARLWSSGFEQNSTANGVEFTATTTNTSVVTTTPHSGTYAGRTTGTNAVAEFKRDWRGTAGNDNVYIRLYLRVADLPDSTVPIVVIEKPDGTDRAYVKLTAAGNLQLFNATTQIGIDSTTALTDSTKWYSLEIHFDSTPSAGNDILEAKLDGTTFASSTTESNLNTVGRLTFGQDTAGGDTYDIYWDDVAINDANGTIQNSWPGDGSIVHLKPNAAGDSTQWTLGAGTGANYLQVDEVTPDDATTYVKSSTGGNIDDYNVVDTAGIITANSTIKVVQVGVRAQRETNPTGTEQIVPRIKASAGGTLEESTSNVALAIGFETNGSTSNDNYPLTLYDLPGASTTTWTLATLDTAQIGVRNASTNTAFIDVTAIWLLVDYVPPPTISSAANQAFEVGQDPSPISQITVTAKANNQLTAANDIRIRIPAGFDMTWDETDTTATIGGTASAKASTTVSYEPAGCTTACTTLVVNLTSNLTVNETLTVSGLNFARFTAAEAAANLELLKDGSADTAVDATDDKTITIVVPQPPILSSAANQVFRLNDPATAISQITVTAKANNQLTAANDIRIRIPAGFSMTWDETDTAATIGGTASAKASTTVSYEPAGCTTACTILVVNVTSNMAVNETLTISGLSFTRFTTAEAADNLELLKDGPADTVVDATDDKTITIAGALALADHPVPETDKFTTAASLTGAELFSFKLTPTGENVSVTNLVISLSSITGIVMSPTTDITNAKLWQDTGATSGAVDGTDTQVGGAGAVSISGASGTITFSTAFTVSAATNYILQADVANLAVGDKMTVSLTTANITATGATTSASLTATGTTTGVTHRQDLTISGTLYSDEGTTAITGSSKTISYSVGGAAASSTTTNSADGTFSFGADAASGTVLTVYVDNDVSVKAVTVTRMGSSNITGLQLYQNRLIVRHEDAGPTTNANLDSWDSGNDADVQFTVTAGALTVANGHELHVWTGDTLTPGGAVNVGTSADAGSDVHVIGTLSLAGNNLTVYGGDITGAGTITQSASGTTTLKGTGSIAGGTYTFYNFTVGDGSTSSSITAAGIFLVSFTVSNDFTITSSTGTNSFDASLRTITVGGNWSNAETFTAGTSTITFNAGAAKIITTGGSSFYNVTFNNASGSWSFAETTVTVNNNFTITAGSITGPSAGLTLGGSWSNSGTYTHNSATVTMTGAGTPTTQADLSTVEATNSVGEFTSLALDSSGFPVISYHSISLQDLKLVHCNDANCAGANESIVTVDATGDVGWYTSLALDASGNPIISYYDATVGNNDLKLVHCNDANCAGANESIVTVDATGDVGQYTSLVLDSSGFPVISYYDATNDDLKLAHCNDANCAGANESIVTVDATGNVGQYTSLVLDSSGFPVISYSDATNTNLKLVHCNDANCAGANESIVTVDTTSSLYTSLALDASGNPVISYYDATNTNLKLVHCNDANCAGANESIVTVDATGNVGSSASLALDTSGFPVISYSDATNTNLKLVHCNDANCAGANESIVTVDTTSSLYTSLALDASGNPVISYYDNTSADLELAHGKNPNAGWFALTSTGGGTKSFYNLTCNGSGKEFLLESALDVDNNLTITAGTLNTKAGENNAISVGGNWSNSGTFAAQQGTVTFDAAALGKTITTGGSAFYGLTFNGSSTCTSTATSACWTLTDATNVGGALNVTNGYVRWGDGNGDTLTTTGATTIASTGKLESLQTLAQGSSMTWTASGTITVGEASGTSSTVPNLDLGKNVTLNFNSATSVEDGLEVDATGNLEIQGELAQAATAIASASEVDTATTITVSGTPWTTNQFANMHLRIANTSSLAFGRLYTISSNTASSLTLGFIETAPSATATVASITGSGPTRTVTVNSTTFITANDQGIGRYLYDSTGTLGYYKIVDSTDGGAGNDSFVIIAEPDAFASLAANDTVRIVDGIRAADTFEIYDYATVTANATNNGYIYLKAGSQSLIRYADLSELGAAVANKEGVTASSVNGANANEGFTLEKSRIYNGYRGVYLTGSSNNTLTSNTVYSNSLSGISLLSSSNLSSSNNNTLTSNTSYNNNFYGIILAGGSNNTLSSNTSYNNNSYGIILAGGSNNTLNSNTTYSSATTGILLWSSSNNTLTSNAAYNNSSSGIYLSGGSNNTLSSNTTYSNTNYGIYLDGSSNNTLSSNTTYSNTSQGILLSSSSNNTLFSNSSYSNPEGLRLADSPGTVAINESYGVSGANTTADVRFADTSSASTLRLYNSTLGSSTEATVITLANAYVLSRKHDTTAGQARLWGEYSVPADDATTQQVESTDKLNYADNLYEHSNSPPRFSGTGNGALTVNALPAGLSAVEWYRAEVTTAATNGGTFTVTRSGGTASPATLALPGTASGCATYAEATTSVSFQICDGATDFALRDTFTFVVWPKSSDTNSQKILAIQQADDKITVAAGRTLELKGGTTGTNQDSQMTHPNAGTWDLDASGTLNVEEATINDMDLLGGILTVINTTLNTETVVGGTLIAEWYVSLHVVSSANDGNNIDTGDTDITLCETSPSPFFVIYKWSAGTWGTPLSCQSIGTDLNGQSPAPKTDGSLRIREYSKTSAATTFYRYNVTIAAQSGYNDYDYYRDHGSNYLTSSLNTGAGLDSTMSETWFRAAIATPPNPEDPTNDPPTKGHWHLGLLRIPRGSSGGGSVGYPAIY